MVRQQIIAPSFGSKGKLDEDALYRWIVAEYRSRHEGLNRLYRAMLARDIAAAAYNFGIADVIGPSRKQPLAQKRLFIAVIIQALSGAQYKDIGRLVGRSRCLAMYAVKVHGCAIKKLLKRGGL